MQLNFMNDHRWGNLSWISITLAKKCLFTCLLSGEKISGFLAQGFNDLVIHIESM